MKYININCSQFMMKDGSWKKLIKNLKLADFTNALYLQTKIVLEVKLEFVSSILEWAKWMCAPDN